MYEALGFTGGKAILVSGIYNCVGPIASKYWYRASNLNSPLMNDQDFIFIVFILDRVGRRKPLLFGTIGITLALMCEGIIKVFTLL